MHDWENLGSVNETRYLDSFLLKLNVQWETSEAQILAPQSVESSDIQNRQGLLKHKNQILGFFDALLFKVSKEVPINYNSFKNLTSNTT